MHCRVRLAIFCAMGILATGATLRAHDFWMEASSYHPPINSLVSFRLFIGHPPQGEALIRSPYHLVEFVIADAQAVKPVRGRWGLDPAGFARLEQGLYVVGYRSARYLSCLPGADFEKYLQNEGLEWVIQERTQRGENAKEGREFYSRCAKAILFAGDNREMLEGRDRLLGFPLELVAEKNPYPLHAGDELPLRLYYLGQPIRGVTVVAISAKKPQEFLASRSDVEGRVTFSLPASGIWFFKAVQIIALPPAETEANWESYWASLTLEIPESLR